MSSPLPRRPVRSLGLSSLAAVFLLGVSSLGLAGCPGDLDPRLLGTGTGGTGGPSVCDGAALMVMKCGQPGCHGSAAPQSANLDLASGGVISRLLGQSSDAAANPICATNTKALLVSGSNPADGLLLDKLDPVPPCGTVMPQVPGPLGDTDMQCMREWATAVTTGMIQ